MSKAVDPVSQLFQVTGVCDKKLNHDWVQAKAHRHVEETQS